MVRKANRICYSTWPKKIMRQGVKKKHLLFAKTWGISYDGGKDTTVSGELRVCIQVNHEHSQKFLT